MKNWYDREVFGAVALFGMAVCIILAIITPIIEGKVLG